MSSATVTSRKRPSFLIDDILADQDKPPPPVNPLGQWTPQRELKLLCDLYPSIDKQSAALLLSHNILPPGFPPLWHKLSLFGSPPPPDNTHRRLPPEPKRKAPHKPRRHVSPPIVLANEAVPLTKIAESNEHSTNETDEIEIEIGEPESLERVDAESDAERLRGSIATTSAQCSPLDALFKMTNTTFTEPADIASKIDSVHTTTTASDLANLDDLLAKHPHAKKKRKSRTAFTNGQIFELEKRFCMQKYLTPADRDDIAGCLGLSNAQVITWFQNRRAKLKRDLEELKADVTATSGVASSLEQISQHPLLCMAPPPPQRN